MYSNADGTELIGWDTQGVKQGGSIRTDLELEGVTVCPLAKVAVPDGAVVDILLSEGSRGCVDSVIGQWGAPAFWWAVSGHGHQNHLTYTEKVEAITDI